MEIVFSIFGSILRSILGSFAVRNVHIVHPNENVSFYCPESCEHSWEHQVYL